jgi:hypothetical protein
LEWLGDVNKMEETGLAKRIFSSESQNERKCGISILRWQEDAEYEVHGV